MNTTAAPQPQTIPADRQAMATAIGQTFNSIHEFLNNLAPLNEQGQLVLTKQLEQAHVRTDEAAMWAIKSVLQFGVAPRTEAAEVATADGAPLPTDNASGTEAV